ncbi:DUF3035 domain-containing protein [Pseudorhodobacter sp. MZDSW-24AT]|uniref:DUF3035 domain-containing protein n=1 Tax=Pseudorhodobacter sp. MZDSW-24AT TaxID=2052957 RepID=UPI000C1F81F4|nr:DUF3035 domain-containing protein [Pseudorhodobacter sp. MZDSW-24AT]PJF08737.1 DUF3035 domain-containing protein [Pseudorhodobacter sp. MZDSW-24AT]
MQTARIILAVSCAALLAGCGNGGDGPQLMNIRSTTAGPDEFGILPPKPLEMPTDLAQLPEPTPGGTNRTDPTPEADAILALGGNPGAGAGLDAGLVAHVTRFGVAPGIRQTVASEDLQWRRDNNGRVLERLFNVNVYYRAYEDQALDQQAELGRWRQRGVRTPSAPPPPAE